MTPTFRYLMEAVSLPLIKLNQVYHVGSMDRTQKTQDSYEGNGLSVSLHPDEWRQIGRGMVGGETWILEKDNGAFLDAHSLTQNHWKEIASWAISQGYVEETTIYRFRYYDDEMEDVVYSDFTNREDAEYESEEYDDTVEDNDGKIYPKIEEIKGELRGSEKLRQRIKVNFKQLDKSFLLPVFVEDRTSLDGVWWEDDLDPIRYSAPRGVIVPSRLSSWVVNKG